MEFVFLFTGILLGYFLNVKRVEEISRKAQEKINTKIKKFKKYKIESVKFKS